MATERRAVDVYLRQEQTPWGLRAYGPGDEIALTSVGARLPLDVIYAGVTVP